jgi:geranylgeranyl diphosphate synthase type II
MKKSDYTFERLKTCYLPLIESELTAWLTPSHPCPQEGLFEAARYSTLGAGKRLRPLLVFAVGDLYEAPKQALLEFACALEMIHSYSLIHDDLPAMDNDDYRRGKKSLHKVVGDGIALLTGDFLLTYAFQKIALSPSFSNELKVKLIQLMGECAGHEGMVGGQYADLTSHQHPQNPEVLKWMHLIKTGALMRLCMEGACCIAGVSPTTCQSWAELGSRIGLLFQIVDDLLDDLPSTTSKVPLGPSSFISMAGVENTWNEARRLKSELIERCQQLDPDRPVIHEIIEAITRQYEQLPQIAPCEGHL